MFEDKRGRLNITVKENKIQSDWCFSKLDRKIKLMCSLNLRRQPPQTAIQVTEISHRNESTQVWLTVQREDKERIHSTSDSML